VAIFDAILRSTLDQCRRRSAGSSARRQVINPAEANGPPICSNRMAASLPACRVRLPE